MASNMITYHSYLYIGTNEDFLNNGGPHPKERTLLQALQASLSKHLENNNNPMPIEIQAKDTKDALEKWKTMFTEVIPQPEFVPILIIADKDNQFLCSQQLKFSKGFHLNPTQYE